MVHLSSTALTSSATREHMRDALRALARISKATLYAYNEERRLREIPPPQPAPTAAPTSLHENDMPQTVQSTRRTRPAHPVNADTVPYPMSYDTTDFTQGFTSGFDQTDFNAGFSQFRSPDHPAYPSSSYESDFSPLFSYPSTVGYVPSEHGLSSQDMPSSSTHPPQSEPRRRYNTRTAEKRRQPHCGIGDHRGHQH